MIWIEVDDQGLIIAERIVAVGQAETAPMKRLLALMPAEKVIILTGGQRRQSVTLLDSGHAVVTALSVSDMMIKLHQINQGVGRFTTLP